jgi:c-di-GMP-binding flagellar brake protein YcgR
MRISPTPTQAASTAGSSVFLKASRRNYRGVERRRDRRVPKSVGILVQPLSQDQVSQGDEFFAITRDISKGGLAFLSPRQATFDMAVLSLEEEPSRMVISRICNSSLIFANELEEVYLTSVEFLYERFA